MTVKNDCKKFDVMKKLNLPKSLEHLFSILPIGVSSKNDIGALIIELKSRLCKLIDALMQIVKKVVVLIKEKINKVSIIPE